MKVHLGVKPHKCEHCGKGFPEKYQLTMHVRSHTNERPYACNICDRRFNQVSNLYTHMRFHSNELPFVYQHEFSHVLICYSILETHDHNAHMCTFCLRDRQYKCNLCQKEFWFRAELSRHMRRHTGERNHKCEICNETFFSLCELRVHIGMLKTKIKSKKNKINIL
jgi:KRAB domain-containing zinc finger protein